MTSINFTVSLTPERLQLYEVVARLRNLTLQQFLFEQIVVALTSRIEDTRDKKALNAWNSDDKALSIDNEIRVTCHLYANASSLRQISNFAAEDGQTVQEYLDDAVTGGADCELENVGRYMTKAKPQAAQEA